MSANPSPSERPERPAPKPPRDIRSDADLAADVPAAGADEPEEDGAPSEELAGFDEDVADLELDLMRVERDEYLDSLRRLQAEFENFRKRTQRQHQEASERAIEALVERLLPVLDAFDLALAHASESTTETELAGAFAQIGALLQSTLEREGLERIDETDARFDPNVHDAVAHDEVDPEEGEAKTGVVVAEVLRAGYRLKGRVLRPAMVRVTG